MNAGCLKKCLVLWTLFALSAGSSAAVTLLIYVGQRIAGETTYSTYKNQLQYSIKVKYQYSEDTHDSGYEDDPGYAIVSPGGQIETYHFDNGDLWGGLDIIEETLLSPPVITSALTMSCSANNYAAYLITASNSPTMFQAAGLPPGFQISGGSIWGQTPYGATYIAQITASNPYGSDTKSLVITISGPPDSIPPTIPSSVGYQNVGFDRATIRWVAANDNVGVTGYEVRRDATSLGVFPGLTATATDLSPASTYSFCVRAQDRAGNWSGWSPPVAVTTMAYYPPSVPHDITVSRVDGSYMFVQWMQGPHSADLAYDEVMLDGLIVGTAHGGFDLRGLAPSTTYTIKIRTRDVVGNYSSWTVPIRATTKEAFPLVQSAYNTWYVRTGQYSAESGWSRTWRNPTTSSVRVLLFSRYSSTWGDCDENEEWIEVAPNGMVYEYDKEWDYDYGSDRQEQSISDYQVTSIPLITSALELSVAQGTPIPPYTITTVTGASSYAASGLPAGLSVAPASGIITGTPSIAGTIRSVISAERGGVTSNATLVWKVAADTVPPSVPVVLSAKSTAVGQFSPQWSASEDNYSVAVYEVTDNGALVWSGNGLQTTLALGPVGTTHSIRVRARDGVGNWSAFSAPFEAKAVTIEISGGSVAQDLVSSGSTVAITASLPPAGKFFAGWSVTSGAGTFSNSGNMSASVTHISGDRLAVAPVYKDGYKLILPEGCSASAYGGKVGDVIAITAPQTLNGNVFDGWYLSGGLSDLAGPSQPTTAVVLKGGDVSVQAFYFWSGGGSIRRPIQISMNSYGIGTGQPGQIGISEQLMCNTFAQSFNRPIDHVRIEYSGDLGRTWQEWSPSVSYTHSGWAPYVWTYPNSVYDGSVPLGAFSVQIVQPRVYMPRLGTMVIRSWAYDGAVASQAAYNVVDVLAQNTVIPYGKFVAQPQDRSGQHGVGNVTFTCTFEGPPEFTNFSWRWQKMVATSGGGVTATEISGSEGTSSGSPTVTPALTVASVSQNAGRYRLYLTDGRVSYFSTEASLIIQDPAIVTPPANVAKAVGSAAELSVVAASAGALSYQWYKNGSIIAGATQSRLAFNSVQLADAGTYKVVVGTTLNATTASAEATLVLLNPPVITSQPVSVATNAGATVTFTSAATGTAPLSWQWRKAGTPITGATNATLTVTNVQPVNVGSYDVVVSNSVGSITSNVAELALLTAPVVSAPASQTVLAGGVATFSVVVSGVPPPTLQWQRWSGGIWSDLATGGNYFGVTLPTLTVSSVTTAMSGAQFRCVATNSAGTATSNAATLTVGAAPNITSAATAAGVVGLPFSYQIAATNGPQSFTATALPAGLSINGSTGVITGVPVTIGTYNVPITAANASGIGTSTLSLTIAKGNQTVAFASLSDRLATEQPFTLSATATSGLPVTFSVVSGPAAISGNVVTLAGSTGSVTIRAAQPGDANYNAASPVEQTFAVRATGPVITSAPSVSGVMGTPFSYTITATNSPTSYNALDTLPAGLTLTASSGIIAGTPTQAGTFNVRLSASNPSATSPAFSLAVTILLPPPTGVHWTGVGQRSLALSWTAPAGVVASDYDVYVNDVIYATVQSTEVTINGLSPASPYNVKVRARDSAGNISAWGSEVFATTLGEDSGSSAWILVPRVSTDPNHNVVRTDDGIADEILPVDQSSFRFVNYTFDASYNTTLLVEFFPNDYWVLYNAWVSQGSDDHATVYTWHPPLDWTVIYGDVHVSNFRADLEASYISEPGYDYQVFGDSSGADWLNLGNLNPIGGIHHADLTTDGGWGSFVADNFLMESLAYTRFFVVRYAKPPAGVQLGLPGIGSVTIGARGAISGTMTFPEMGNLKVEVTNGAATISLPGSGSVSISGGVVSGSLNLPGGWVLGGASNGSVTLGLPGGATISAGAGSGSLTIPNVGTITISGNNAISVSVATGSGSLLKNAIDELLKVLGLGSNAANVRVQVNNGTWGSINGANIGGLPVGTHTVRVTNSTRGIPEDENVITLTWTVRPLPPAASMAGPVRMWINDDNDSGDTGGDDIPGNSSPNYADSVVNGNRDLVDFFPISLAGIRPLIATYGIGPDVVYKLKQADSAVNFVYTNKTPATAQDYVRQLQTTGFSDTFDQPAGSAATHQVTAAGVSLSQAFLTLIRDNGGGILLIEGRAQSTNPLVLSVEKPDGTVLTTVQMPLLISAVETMFRHVDMTAVAKEYNGTALSPPVTGMPNRFADPGNPYPDSATNGKYFVFVHGYNVDARKSRGWECEVFKRLYQMGSRARFVGVDWHGATGVNYHKAVFNAFQTGDLLKTYLNAAGVSGDITIAAHSLGNIVVSQAIQSGGFAPARYYMINAAVPLEAYDYSGGSVTAAQRIAMTEHSWKSQDSSTFASNWHQLFAAAPSDNRNKLNWKNRFSGVLNTAVFNFYSPGDDVVENPRWDDASFLTIIKQQGFEFSRGAWVTQEFAKGQSFFESGIVATLFDRIQGGWGQSVDYRPGSTPSPDMKREPYFGYFWEHDLFNTDVTTASTKAGQQFVQYDLLARGIPALSYATAVNPILPLSDSQNFNMETQGRPSNVSWPSDGHTSNSLNLGRWLHSDFKNVALPYVYQMYQAMIDKGGL